MNFYLSPLIFFRGLKFIIKRQRDKETKKDYSICISKEQYNES